MAAESRAGPLTRASSRARSPTRRSKERCLYPIVNEGAKILEEGKAIRASDIDVIWQNGYGWPVYRGGPMFWGDQIGAAKIAATMAEYEGQMAAAYESAKLLEEQAAEGKAFTR